MLMLNVQAIYIFSVYVAIVEVFVFVILREMSLNSVVWGWLIYFFSSLAVLNLLVDFQAHLIISLRSALLVMFIQCDFFHPAFRFSPKVKHRRPAAIFSGGFVKARRAKCPPPRGVTHPVFFPLSEAYHHLAFSVRMLHSHCVMPGLRYASFFNSYQNVA